MKPTEIVEGRILQLDIVCCELSARFDFDTGGDLNFLEDVCWTNITTNTATASL